MEQWRDCKEVTYLIPRGWQEVHSREKDTIQAKRAVVSRHWWSLALIFQAWPYTLILRSSLRRGVKWEANVHSSSHWRIQEDSNQHGIFLAEQQQGCPSNVLQEEVLKRLTRRLQSPPQSWRLKKTMQWLFVKRNGARDSSVQARRKTHLTNIPHICKGST